MYSDKCRLSTTMNGRYPFVRPVIPAWRRVRAIPLGHAAREGVISPEHFRSTLMTFPINSNDFTTAFPETADRKAKSLVQIVAQAVKRRPWQIER
jgi:hypothetical protein